MSEAEALCPRCGYLTLTMLDWRLVCSSQACGYEHDVTGAIPIVKREDKP